MSDAGTMKLRRPFGTLRWFQDELAFGGQRWAAGQASVDTWIAANNHPGVDPNYSRRGTSLPSGYTEEYVLDQPSVQRDDGWVMNFGALRGQVPKARVYITKVTTSFSNGSPEQLDEVHVSILDGKAYVFYYCSL